MRAGRLLVIPMFPSPAVASTSLHRIAQPLPPVCNRRRTAFGADGAMACRSTAGRPCRGRAGDATRPRWPPGARRSAGRWSGGLRELPPGAERRAADHGEPVAPRTRRRPRRRAGRRVAPSAWPGSAGRMALGQPPEPHQVQAPDVERPGGAEAGDHRKPPGAAHAATTRPIATATA